MIKLLCIVVSFLLVSTASAEVNFIADYDTYSVVNSHRTYDENLEPTDPFSGRIPFIASVGLESVSGNFTYSGGYLLKKDTDIFSGRAYDYEGMFFKVRYRHCIYNCNPK